MRAGRNSRLAQSGGTLRVAGQQIKVTAAEAKSLGEQGVVDQASPVVWLTLHLVRSSAIIRVT